MPSGLDPGRAPQLSARAQRAARRFAEVVGPPGMLAHHRTDRVMAEFELMLGALAPTARKGLGIAFVALDQGARLYPRSRGRRFTRLDDQAAEAYIRALLTRQGLVAQVGQRLKGFVMMCYYELPTVQREIGYDPAPYIAAVSRRRLESYGTEIRAGEAAVTSAQVRSDQSRDGEQTGQGGEQTGQGGEQMGKGGEQLDGGGE